MHCAHGPAVRWNGGRSYFFWHGVHVTEDAIPHLAAIDGQGTVIATDVEVLQVMIEHVGYDRMVLELGIAPFDVDEVGALYRVRFPGEAPLTFVHVRNSTPEPDGSWKWYFLRVPPDMRSGREAVAWTFGLHADEYAPALET